MINIEPHKALGNPESMNLRYPTDYTPPVEAPFVYLTGGRLASDPTGSRAAQTLTGARLK